MDPNGHSGSRAMPNRIPMPVFLGLVAVTAMAGVALLTATLQARSKR